MDAPQANCYDKNLARLVRWLSRKSLGSWRYEDAHGRYVAAFSCVEPSWFLKLCKGIRDYQVMRIETRFHRESERGSFRRGPISCTPT